MRRELEGFGRAVQGCAEDNPPPRARKLWLAVKEVPARRDGLCRNPEPLQGLQKRIAKRRSLRLAVTKQGEDEDQSLVVLRRILEDGALAFGNLCAD